MKRPVVVSLAARRRRSSRQAARRRRPELPPTALADVLPFVPRRRGAATPGRAS